LKHLNPLKFKFKKRKECYEFKVCSSSDKVEDLLRELKKKKLEDAIIEFIEPENVIVVY